MWYTDASKSKKGVGVGISGPRTTLSLPLGKYPSVFQAEIYAINECIIKCLNKGMNDAKIFIITDSQAALKVLDAFSTKSAIVWECLQNLNTLASKNTVVLLWVKAHIGVAGNELADKLAKKASRANFTGPEPAIGLTKNYIASDFEIWENNLKAQAWRSASGMRQAKSMITPSSDRSNILTELSKKELRTITGLLTGHCPLRYHLHLMGKSQLNTCRFCNKELETSNHILCTCTELNELRYLHLGKTRLDNRDVGVIPPRKILSFIKAANLEEL